MKKFVIALTLCISCATTGKIPYEKPSKGSLARALQDAHTCGTPVSWAEHTPSDPDTWFGVCGDANGNPLYRF